MRSKTHYKNIPAGDMEKVIVLNVTSTTLRDILNGDINMIKKRCLPKYRYHWVYLYCGHTSPILYKEGEKYKLFGEDKSILGIMDKIVLNGRVVARFWLDGFYERGEEFWWVIKEPEALDRPISIKTFYKDFKWNPDRDVNHDWFGVAWETMDKLIHPPTNYTYAWTEKVYRISRR